jgi:hypothetical protein
MSNIVPKQAGQMILAGHESLDASDYRPPKVTIGQPTSKGEGVVGKFAFSTGERRESLLEVVPILATKTRVLFGKGFGNKAATCASDNFFKPADRIENPICDRCAEAVGNKAEVVCPAAKWGDKHVDKAQVAKNLGLENSFKPLCQESVNLFLMDKEGLLPYWLSLQKTQIEVVQQQLFTAYLMRGLPFYQASVDIKLQKISNDRGTFYKVWFSNIQKLDDLTAEKFKGIYNMYSGRAEKDLADLHAEQDASHGEEPPF